MEYDQLIKGWHEHAAKSSTKEYFSRFVFEYLAFVAFLRTKIAGGSILDDRKRIQQLKRDQTTKCDYLKKVKMNQELSGSWRSISNRLDKKHLENLTRIGQTNTWWNCSHTESNQKTPSEVSKRNGVVHSLDDWENMIEFWYIVRNNLFHGAKNIVEERDQFLVQYGYLTLRELMEILLHD